MPAAEQLPSPESERPSNRLILHVVHGQHDANESLPDQLPDKVSEKSLNALRNQNKKIRENDAKRVEEIIKSKAPDHAPTSDEIRQMQFQIWRAGILSTLGRDLGFGDRGSKTAQILRDKLHIQGLTGNGQQDSVIIAKALYDEGTQTGGSFYKEFCGQNMNEVLANALTTDEMLHMKAFLKDWMVGTDTAFDALVALRMAKDSLTDEVKRAQLTKPAPLSERDKKTLSFYHEGATFEEEKKQPINIPAEIAQPEPQAQSEHLMTRIGSATETHPEHPDRNDDTFFLDPEKQRGGIFDGAGGYDNGNLASQIARDTMQEVLGKLPFPAGEQQVADALSDALRLADERVKAFGKQGKTTVAAFQIVENPDGTKSVIAVNVGDSRIWIRHSDGTISQVTQDGSRFRNIYVERFNTATSNEEREAATNGYNAMIERINNAQTQADIDDAQLNMLWTHRNETNLLGSDKSLDQIAELTKTQLQEGDVIFMTTDGVHDNLTSQQIAEIAKNAPDPKALSEQLVAKAKEVSGNGTFRSKPDDITAAALTIRPEQQKDRASQEQAPQAQPATEPLEANASVEETTVQNVEKIIASLRQPGIRRLGKEITFTNEEIQEMQTFTQEARTLLDENPELQDLLKTIKHYVAIDTGFSIAVGFAGTGIVVNPDITTPRVIPATSGQQMRIQVPPQLFTLYIAHNNANTASSLLQQYQDTLTTGGTGTLGSFLALNLEKTLDGYRQLKGLSQSQKSAAETVNAAIPTPEDTEEENIRSLFPHNQELQLFFGYYGIGTEIPNVLPKISKSPQATIVGFGAETTKKGENILVAILNVSQDPNHPHIVSVAISDLRKRLDDQRFEVSQPIIPDIPQQLKAVALNYPPLAATRIFPSGSANQYLQMKVVGYILLPIPLPSGQTRYEPYVRVAQIPYKQEGANMKPDGTGGTTMVMSLANFQAQFIPNA